MQLQQLVFLITTNWRLCLRFFVNEYKCSTNVLSCSCWTNSVAVSNKHLLRTNTHFWWLLMAKNLLSFLSCKLSYKPRDDSAYSFNFSIFLGLSTRRSWLNKKKQVELQPYCYEPSFLSISWNRKVHSIYERISLVYIIHICTCTVIKNVK